MILGGLSRNASPQPQAGVRASELQDGVKMTGELLLVSSRNDEEVVAVNGRRGETRECNLMQESARHVGHIAIYGTETRLSGH